MPDNWDLGSALVNQVPSLGEALGVLGKKKVMEKTRESLVGGYNLKPVGKLSKLATKSVYFFLNTYSRTAL